MNFDSMTTDELEAEFPESEDNRWEFKDAIYLTKDKRGALDAELGKQVSAFANTGGGYLVFGVDKTTKTPQPCEQFVGRTSMKDFLTTKVSSSVENPIGSFRVHRIPFTSDPTQAVYLVEIPDSPAAPHQAKIEKRYYWRLDGSSEAAPHFHLELLRNRFTKSVLEIGEIRRTCDTEQFQVHSGNQISTTLVCHFVVPIRNISMQFTSAWGIHVKATGDTSPSWKVAGQKVVDGACERGMPSELLPGQRGHVAFDVKNIVTTCSGLADHNSEIKNRWAQFGIVVSPVSHNHMGTEVYNGWNESEEKQKEARAWLCNFMKNRKQDIGE